MPTAVTHTLKPSGQGGDYSAMSTWESNEQRNLTALDESDTLLCEAGDYGGPDGALSDRTYFAQWVTSRVNGQMAFIRNDVGSEHNGLMRSQGGTGFACIRSAGGFCLSFNTGDLDVTGIEIGSVSSPAMTTDGTGRKTMGLDTCIVHAVNASGTARLCDIKHPDLTDMLIKNTLFIGGGGWGIEARASSVMTFEHCTWGNVQSRILAAYSSSTAPLIKNCVSGYGGGLMWSSSGGWDAASSNNIGSGSDTPGTGAINNVDLTTPGLNYTDPSTYDFRPVVGGAIDSDVNPGVYIPAIPNDLTGFARNDPPEVGAYEIQGVAPGVTFDGPDIIAQTGIENQVFTFDENGEGSVASRFTGATSYALSPNSDPLPAGLSVNPTTGNIEGTPTVNGTFTNIIIEGSD